MGKKQKGEGNKEGENLLGTPTFKELENGRFKCLETGHELPAHARESYTQSKHCRLGLIDSALTRNKAPLNMFQQDPLCRSKLTCKLTGLAINKSEEHIWKHINGKRFLNIEKEAEKQTPNGTMEGPSEQKPDKIVKRKADGLKKKKKKKKKKKMEEENVNEVISEVRNPSDKDIDSEEDDFWMPPSGERWDFDDGGDRWVSGSESGPETDGASGPDVGDEEINNDANELSMKEKRKSIEMEPSALATRKKKKTKSTSQD